MQFERMSGGAVGKPRCLLPEGALTEQEEGKEVVDAPPGELAGKGFGFHHKFSS